LDRLHPVSLDASTSRSGGAARGRASRWSTDAVLRAHVSLAELGAVLIVGAHEAEAAVRQADALAAICSALLRALPSWTARWVVSAPDPVALRSTPRPGGGKGGCVDADDHGGCPSDRHSCAHSLQGSAT